MIQAKDGAAWTGGYSGGQKRALSIDTYEEEGVGFGVCGKRGRQIFQ